jgi:hypothetical protein
MVAASAMDVEAPARPPTTTTKPNRRSPHDLLAETRASVEEVAARILAIKKDGAPKADLNELVAQMSLLLITLRQVRPHTPKPAETLALDLPLQPEFGFVRAGEPGDTDGGG